MNIHRDPVIGNYFTEALMHAFHGKDPARFLADFYTSFTADLLADEGDAAPIVDRYHTPDVVQYADGVRIDRDRLIAHAQPVRRNHPEVRVEVHEAVAVEDRLAARYTMHAQMAEERISNEVYFFGTFAPDGRLRTAHMRTRTLSPDEAGEAGG